MYKKKSEFGNSSDLFLLSFNLISFFYILWSIVEDSTRRQSCFELKKYWKNQSITTGTVMIAVGCSQFSCFYLIRNLFSFIQDNWHWDCEVIWLSLLFYDPAFMKVVKSFRSRTLAKFLKKEFKIRCCWLRGNIVIYY